MALRFGYARNPAPIALVLVRMRTPFGSSYGPSAVVCWLLAYAVAVPLAGLSDGSRAASVRDLRQQQRHKSLRFLALLIPEAAKRAPFSHEHHENQDPLGKEKGRRDAWTTRAVYMNCRSNLLCKIMKRYEMI